MIIFVLLTHHESLLKSPSIVQLILLDNKRANDSFQFSALLRRFPCARNYSTTSYPETNFTACLRTNSDLHRVGSRHREQETVAQLRATCLTDRARSICKRQLLFRPSATRVYRDGFTINRKFHGDERKEGGKKRAYPSAGDSQGLRARRVPTSRHPVYSLDRVSTFTVWSLPSQGCN